MPEPRLAPLAALGRPIPVVDVFPGLTIRENPEGALASVAMRLGCEGGFAAAARALFGFDLPGPGIHCEIAPWGAFWTGPEQWFIEAPFASHEDIAARIKAGLGTNASVTEQTDGWARFDVEGVSAYAVFERLCPLDVRKMKSGSAGRTLIEHLGCLVICRIEGWRFSVLGPRSCAASLHHALLTAALSIA